MRKQRIQNWYVSRRNIGRKLRCILSAHPGSFLILLSHFFVRLILQNWSNTRGISGMEEKIRRNYEIAERTEMRNTNLNFLRDSEHLVYRSLRIRKQFYDYSKRTSRQRRNSNASNLGAFEIGLPLRKRKRRFASTKSDSWSSPLVLTFRRP